jgi:hypothetical protein
VCELEREVISLQQKNVGKISGGLTYRSTRWQSSQISPYQAHSENNKKTRIIKAQER